MKSDVFARLVVKTVEASILAAPDVVMVNKILIEL